MYICILFHLNLFFYNNPKCTTFIFEPSSGLEDSLTLSLISSSIKCNITYLKLLVIKLCYSLGNG